MRLFTGLDVPSNTEALLGRLISVLRPAAPNLHWSPLTNLHITTKFIGQWHDDRLDELKDALQTVSKPGALQIPINGVGWFPNPDQPRSLFAAVDAPQGLHDLARGTQEALAAIGIAHEDRKYSPHVTLARLKSGTRLAPLRQAIACYESVDFGIFDANSFHLYASHSDVHGTVYTKLAEFPLQ